MTKEKKKIKPDEFKDAVSKYLEGLMLGVLLYKVPLSTDDEGYIQPNVVTNLKLTVNTVIKMTPDEKVKGKCETFREYLQDYE